MDDWEHLVMEIYEAAQTPEYFYEVAEHISDAAGGASVHLLLSDRSKNTDHLSLLAKGDDAFAGEYSRDYIGHDFRVSRVLSQKRGVLVQEASYVTPDEQKRSEIHQLLLPKYGIHNIVGANLGVDDTIGWFGISTLHADKPFDADQLRFLSSIVPHLHQAFRILKINSELKLSRSTIGSALDVVDAPIFILRDAMLEFANATAMQLINEGYFQIKAGRLSCASRSQSRRITEFLGREAIGNLDTLLLRDIESGVAYLLRLRDVPPDGPKATTSSVTRRIVSVGTVNQPENPHPHEVSAFCYQFGLSRRESAVILAVLSEIPLRNFAGAQGLALNTVQKQLKSAMTKLGLQSQKALFRTYERFRILGSGL